MLQKQWAEQQAYKLIQITNNNEGNTEGLIKDFSNAILVIGAEACIENEKYKGCKNFSTYVIKEWINKSDFSYKKAIPEEITKAINTAKEQGYDEEGLAIAATNLLKESLLTSLQEEITSAFGEKDWMTDVLLTHLKTVDWVTLCKDLVEATLA
jgi:hypothetical protein